MKGQTMEVTVPVIPHEEAQVAADWFEQFCRVHNISSEDKDLIYRCAVTVFVRGLNRKG